MPVAQLSGLIVTVGDLAGTATFYRDALGLKVQAGPQPDSSWNSLLGLEPSTKTHAVEVAIGRQSLKLMAFDPPGLPYPAERASNDQWFQHLALVCGDIGEVWSRLQRGAPGTITKGAPVLLPPNTGGVTAFKFRDTEGHPLELIAFPPGVGDPAWQQAGKGIAGYDHTAVSVADVDRSIAFYTGLLGFRVGGQSLNRGEEQDRLDGLIGCEVDVIALEPVVATTPHVELLHYRSPVGRTSPTPSRANDVASACQILRVDDLDALARRLEAAGVTFVSPGVLTLEDGGKAAAVRDPDGHLIVLTG